MMVAQRRSIRYLNAFLLGVLLLVMAQAADAATTLYIPRRFDSAEMGTVGIALMNPTLSAASITYRLQ
jgi:hypothetical protein